MSCRAGSSSDSSRRHDGEQRSPLGAPGRGEPASRHELDPGARDQIPDRRGYDHVPSFRSRHDAPSAIQGRPRQSLRVNVALARVQAGLRHHAEPARALHDGARTPDCPGWPVEGRHDGRAGLGQPGRG